MLKRITLLVLSLLGLVFSTWALQAPSGVFASTPQEEVCKGVGAGNGTGGCESDISLTKVIRNVINIFSIIIGIVAVIMIMVGGFKYITAAGDSGNITSARNTIVYALIGLAVAALSQFLVWFVLDNVK
jgi:cytochrome bd-type quinol oxidase subunit 2